MRLKFCAGDGMIIGVVVIAAFVTGILFQKKAGIGGGNRVVIYEEGNKVYEMSLNKDEEVTIENRYFNKIVVRDGKVAILESDCPGMDCVHSGWINRGGRSIVCLPNRVEIRIEGESEVDFIVR